MGEGKLLKKDPNRATKYFQYLIKMGYPDPSLDFSIGTSCFFKAAKLGNPCAQLQIALWLHPDHRSDTLPVGEPDVLPKDRDRATSYFQQSYYQNYEPTQDWALEYMFASDDFSVSEFPGQNNNIDKSFLAETLKTADPHNLISAHKYYIEDNILFIDVSSPVPISGDTKEKDENLRLRLSDNKAFQTMYCLQRQNSSKGFLTAPELGISVPVKDVTPLNLQGMSSQHPNNRENIDPNIKDANTELNQTSKPIALNIGDKIFHKRCDSKRL